MGHSASIGANSSDTFTVNASSTFTNPVVIRSSLQVGTGTLNIDSTGSITTTGFVKIVDSSNNTKATLDSTGNLTVAGALTSTASAPSVFSKLTVSGITTLNGVAYTWPSSDGAAGYALSTNGAGTLSWAQAGVNDAVYVTLSANSSLSAERVLTGTANQITLTDNGANSTMVLSLPQDIAGSNIVWTLPSSEGTAGYALMTNGAGALSWGEAGVNNATYVTLSTNSSLSAERVLTGTANQITLTDNGANSTMVLSLPQDIAAASSPTFAGLTLSATPLAATSGGTGISSYALGDILYSSAANTLAKLSGNTAATRKFLRQTGTGSVSAAPAWDTIAAGDLPTAIDASNIANGSVSSAEFQYLGSVTSDIQTQLNAKSPSASPTFTGTVIIPSPFTLGATSMTASGTQLNYLAGATGTTGTTTTNLVFSTSPSLTTPTIGAAIATSIAIGANTVDTNEWANLDGLNQALATTSSPTFANLTISTAGGLRTGTTAGNTLLLQAYDNDTGPGYITFATLTAGNTPTFDLATGTTIGSSYIYRATGTDVAVADGGTGLSTVAAGSVLGANSTDTVLAVTSATGLKLLQNNAGTLSWETVTGTGSPVLGTAPTFTTSITDPLVIGGTGTTSTLTLRSTSGVGASGADIIFQVGNNGATEAMRILNSGSVGIGVSPSYKLDVVSGGSTTARFGTDASDTVVIGGGTGKITVGTIDPVYSIDGIRYATYLPGIIGVKEEVTGQIKVTERAEGTGYKHGIDFASLETGSDLWLFAKAVTIKKHINQLSVLLTPSSNARVWYELDFANTKLAIFSSKPTKVSYRLTAPRFDADQWTNFSHDLVDGFTLPDDASLSLPGPDDMIAGSDSSSDGPDISVFVQAVKDAMLNILASLNGVVRTAGEWVFENITAKNAKVDNLDAQTGFTLYDKATGKPFCVQIENGSLSARDGKCGELRQESLQSEQQQPQAEEQRTQPQETRQGSEQQQIETQDQQNQTVSAKQDEAPQSSKADAPATLEQSAETASDAGRETETTQPAENQANETISPAPEESVPAGESSPVLSEIEIAAPEESVSTSEPSTETPAF
ncbi:MAG: hypothetical protein HYV78_01130 [Candidatus Wildermuthbacteria bacterium]|nr:hypothetical protein [Candidatus Wildermuthbacteria bacterium]